MIETLKAAAVDMIPQGAEWIGLLFIFLIAYQHCCVVDMTRTKEPDEVHWFWTWTMTFIIMEIGYNLIVMIGGIFF